MKALLGMWKASGIKPQALQRKPQLKLGDKYFYDAFKELYKSRDTGDSFGAIKQSEYLAHWESYGVWGIEERAKFQRLVGALDEVFVDHTIEQRRKKAEQAQSKPPSARGGLALK